MAARDRRDRVEALRFGLSSEALEDLKREAEHRARSAYDAATRVIARNGRQLASETGAAVDRLKVGVQAEMRNLLEARARPARTRTAGATTPPRASVGQRVADVLSQAGEQIRQGQEVERQMHPAARDVAGKIWNAPNTLVGLAYGGAGYVAGMAINSKPYVTLGANAIQFRNNPFGGAGAITLGNTTTYNEDPASDWGRYNRGHAAPIWEHERQHTIQGQQLGPLYLLSNALGGGLALLRDRDELGQPDWHGPTNWNERGPQEVVPRPWPQRGRR